ncbi:hypothetical protein COY90_03290 [Candidatus Roizmanbacteria bacterium CG_4_10_14_0_8_um_filter_39_9]|uniref:Glycosyltransferase 2-like domain-containing protein n=1 Tax=Candidatus Roizmanbacteria bacterium CG_4_10_14_0_8_um_filter_39_9 TaxID=1974829 RepID=A0A2M7QCI6_9BACT|nr:MAG: hypothetical protein COY90_03290 [Candidatus Roizmanbacteria bacterium CG_4_10_14_0_8_um_filter_39_9]
MASKKIDLSVIIISYNTKQITRDCLESVYKSLNDPGSPTFEVIVVDNVSKDGSVEMFLGYEKKYDNFTLLANNENVGFARANNQANKIAKGTHILLLNSDTVILKDAISSMFNYYTKHPEIHFLGPKLFNVDMTPQASAAAFYSPAVVFAALFLRGDYWGLTRNSPDSTMQVDWVSGACILCKKEYYDAIGGFDEGIFMYMDEVDMLFRAKKKGLITFFYHKAHVIHLGSASSKSSVKRTAPILQVYKGFRYFYEKHYSPFDLILLKIMLQLKAGIALIIGYLTNNSYLKSTYEEALKLARY